MKSSSIEKTSLLGATSLLRNKEDILKFDGANKLLRSALPFFRGSKAEKYISWNMIFTWYTTTSKPSLKEH